MADVVQKIAMSEELVEELYEIIKPMMLNVIRGMGLGFHKASYSPGAKKGECFLGRVLQINTINRAERIEKNLHFMVKFGYEKKTRDVYPLRKGYEREVFIYEKVFPRFEQLQTHLVNPFKAYPVYYGSNCITIPEYILLSDMRYKEYKMINRLEPLNYNHMLVAVSAYARLHALSFALREKDPAAFAEISIGTQNHFDLGIVESTVNHIKIHLERAINTLNPDTDKDALIKFQRLEQQDFHQLMLQATEAQNAGVHAVVCHGDASITNFMYNYSRNRANLPFNIVFLDFQLAKLGSPALDLSQLFFMCTDKTVRDQHYAKLLEEYHKELLFAAKELKIEINMSLETLHDHMKKFSIYGLYRTIFSLYVQMCNDKDFPEIENFLTWADCMQNYNFACSNEDMYKERMRGVLIDFVKYDYNLYLPEPEKK